MCAVALAGGYALKAQCLEPWDGRQYARLCYNDLQPLYSARGIHAHTFPYVHGDLVSGALVSGAIEYPVLTGLFMWATGLAAADANAYLQVSAVSLAPFGLAVAAMLARTCGRRALMWAAAPALVLYAFHNWDLLVVAAATAGFYLWWRGRPVAAAAVFGIGAAVKMYPALFVLPLVAERLVARDRRGAWLVAGAGAGVAAAINLPFAVAGFDGWWATYEFHGRRGPNWDNVWTWAAGADLGPISLPTLGPLQLNVVTTLLIAVSVAAVLWAGWVRARRDGVFPVVGVAGAMLAAFLLWNKVHSPQYTLWLLPMIALGGLSWWWWAAYSAVDLAVYVGVFRWFYDYTVLGRVEGMTGAKLMMIAGVWARALLLALLVAAFLATRRALAPEDPG